MHGNVSQLCADLYDPKTTGLVFLVDRNTNMASLQVPVRRGGSCYTYASGCRASSHEWTAPGGGGAASAYAWPEFRPAASRDK